MLQRMTYGFFIVAAVAAIGCGKKEEEKKGRPLNLPAIKPPVDAATPAGLGNTGSALVTACGNHEGNAIERIQAALFCPGPTDFRSRLGTIDERIAEYDRRAQENLPVCVDDELKSWDPAGIPEEFPMKIFCYEPMGGDSNLSVYFGKDDENSYIIETQTGGGGAPALGVYARIANSGDQVSFWQGYYDSSSKKSAWMSLTADRAAKTMEFVNMGTASGYGIGCGINLKSNADLIYVKGSALEPSSQLGCNTQDPTLSAVDLCYDAATLAEVDKAQCETAGLTTFSKHAYTTNDVETWDTQELAEKLVSGDGVPSGIRAFTESNRPTEDSSVKQ